MFQTGWDTLNSTLNSILNFERPAQKINSLGSEFLLTEKSILACLDPLK